MPHGRTGETSPSTPATKCISRQLLAEGKTLYRDVWFMYGPASPYFNSYLFRVFGIHLNVLYWAGSLGALGSAIFLY